jgi:HSP20 family protein
MPTQRAKTDEELSTYSQNSRAFRSSRPTALAPRVAALPAGVFRTNPFSIMRRMTEEMERIFGDIGQLRESNGDVLWAPAVELSECEGNYVVRAKLPGLEPEDLKLEIDNDALVLQGERKVEREARQSGTRRTDIRSRRFYRCIPLPEGASTEQIRARFNNGILELTVPMLEHKAHRKQIPIETSSSASTSSS